MEAWDPALALGEAELDDAHELLYQLNSATEEAVARGDLRTARWKLDELFDVTGAHFAAEERWMRETAYPAAAGHQADHAAYLGELHKLRKELGASGLSPLFRLWFGSRFTGWLRLHVKGMDQQFHRHLRLWKEAQALLAAVPPPGAPPAAGTPGAAAPSPAAAPAPKPGA
ncbi:MAG: hemerythrin family protein [Anaeromyxobacter sp.]|nr:hemerythrin family protein [Anaeromyxobacter sp.]